MLAITGEPVSNFPQTLKINQQPTAAPLEVHASAENLRNAIGGLQERMNTLNVRLSPVLRATMTGAADKAARPESSVPLAETINVETDRVSALIEQVSGILNQLEV